jgi:hypothetical protein
MTGTAGKYCSAIIRREKNIAFEELVSRMEKRFILRKLVATVHMHTKKETQSSFLSVPSNLSDFGADTVCLLKFLDILTFEMSGTCRVLCKLLGKLN